jgi:hypothetical protein
LRTPTSTGSIVNTGSISVLINTIIDIGPDAWERGEKHPRGASLKLLALVAKNGLRAVA